MIANLYRSEVGQSNDSNSIAVVLQERTYEGLVLVKQNNLALWFFQDDCEIMCSNVENESNSKPIALHITSLNSLYSEGSYNYKLQQWRRLFITQYSNISLRLLEDVPESSGQKCLWNACIVLTRYLEAQFHLIGMDWSALSVLELGAGAALLSLFSHIVMNAHYVSVTEQATCMEYTLQNIHQNKQLINFDKIDIMELDWGNAVIANATNNKTDNTNTNNTNTTNKTNKTNRSSDIVQDTNNHLTFDIIIGCDITFNPVLIDKLLITIQYSLNNKTSICYLCHDEESCPSAKNIWDILSHKVLLYNMSIIQLDNYRDYIDIAYHRPSIHIWKLMLL